MSERQYYEFQTIDRLLTEAERAEVEELSFDAGLYLANWGTRRLMFRFPNEQGLAEPRGAFVIGQTKERRYEKSG